MGNTIKYERRFYYDSYGTGNFTEDKSRTFYSEISEEKAIKFVKMWLEMGASHYETSRAHFYEMRTDARHFTECIIYK